MSAKFYAIALLMVQLLGCATLEDAGRSYFRQGMKVKGVEPAESLIRRMEEEQKLRNVMYGEAKSAKIVQCTLLRNQLYVAAMKNSSDKDVMSAVKILENAYQENDASFLTACDQVLGMGVGKVFIKIQHEELAKLRS